jgi:hypothetical protein
MQQRHSTIWTVSSLVAGRSLWFLLRRIGRRPRKCV